LVTEYDAKAKIFTHKIEKEDEDATLELEIPAKDYIENLIAYSESYSGITESAIQSFVSLISGYDIDNFYLQNPPMQINQQLEQAFPNMLSVEKYNYKKFNESMFFKINDTFGDNIIGQENVKKRLLISLYPLMEYTSNRKPVVIMFYGNSGIGKTETAKFISKVLGQPLFRKQFSMFHSGEFQGYLFGGNHFQACFARELLERESNVILLDEFDKPHSVFHSAFYQLFDEGIFEDKNYNVELYNSIIICTSNYKSEEEIRKHLGDPIYFRFDKFIKFEDLSEGSLKKVIEMLINKKHESLSQTEKKNVDRDYIKAQLLKNVSKLTNVRQISTIVDEYFSLQLVEKMLEQHSKQIK
jgi:ATP-dependent Clp protease ATP-binding subunit ClpA